MSDQNSAPLSDATAVLQSMTLLATLSTAAEVRSSVVERRAGRDPSAQEPAESAAYRVRNAGRELMDLLMQVALSRVPLAEHEDPLSTAVRHFDLLMKMRRVERLEQEMHQRLLSLYPGVSEALVEEARLTHGEVDRFIDTVSANSAGPHLTDVLERGLSLAVWVRREVSIEETGR